MKALSLLQPWATLVIIGAKKIETRSWSTDFRGTLLIHASMGKAGSVFAGTAAFKKYISDFNSLPFGVIIGQVGLTRIIRANEVGLPDAEMDQLTLEEKIFGDYSEGRYAWLLKDPLEFEHKIPARGQLRLWDFHF